MRRPFGSGCSLPPAFVTWVSREGVKNRWPPSRSTVTGPDAPTRVLARTPPGAGPGQLLRLQRPDGSGCFLLGFLAHTPAHATAGMVVAFAVRRPACRWGCSPSCAIQCICVLQCIYSVSASSPDTEQIQSQIQNLVYTQDILCYPGIIVGYCCVKLKISWDILVCGLVWALAL